MRRCWSLFLLHGSGLLSHTVSCDTHRGVLDELRLLWETKLNQQGLMQEPGGGAEER